MITGYCDDCKRYVDLEWSFEKDQWRCIACWSCDVHVDKVYEEDEN